MARSKWKAPFISLSVLNSIKNYYKGLKKNKVIHTFHRNTMIIKPFVGWTFFVHRGNKYSKIIISKDMVGHKLGSFVFTRTIGRIHKVVSKKKNKK